MIKRWEKIDFAGKLWKLSLCLSNWEQVKKKRRRIEMKYVVGEAPA